MRTLTVEEAVTALGKWLELAVAGEDIRIRNGDSVVELRPIGEKDGTGSSEPLSPREALRQLQTQGRLTAEQAREYLEELRLERLATETGRPA